MAKYEVAILGAGLGGLAAAALLAGKKKTALVGRRETLQHSLGGIEKNGFSFSRYPAQSYGFQWGGEIHEISEYLGILKEISVQNPCYQVALPDRRVTVYPEQKRTLEELRREFPKEIDGLARCYRELHNEAERNARGGLSSYLSKKRSAAGFLRSYRFSRDVMTFFDIPSRYFFQKPAADLSLASLATLCVTPPHHIRGGINSIAGHLSDIILNQGGEVFLNQASAGLAVRNGRVIGIQTAQSVIEAGVVLLNTSYSPRPATLLIGIKDEVVPVGMCREVLFLPDYENTGEFVALSLSAKDDLTAAPHGMTAVTASYRSCGKQAPGKETLLGSIEKLMPFLRDYMVFSAEYGGADREDDLRDDSVFTPFPSTDGTLLLSRGSRKNVYLLDDAQKMPLQVLSAARRFAERMT